MTLDERVRAGLRRSADTGRLDEDEVFEQVQRTHTRGRVRSRVLRQATTVAIVLTLIAGIGVFISLRAAPDRYRTTSDVAVSAAAPRLVGDPLAIALAPGTQRAALQAAHIAPSGNRVDFGAASSSKVHLSLAVTSPSAAESALVIRHWVAAMTPAMKARAARELIARQRALIAKFKALHNELRRVDLELMKVAPLVYHGVLKFDSTFGLGPSTGAKSPPPVPEQGTVRELNLAFLRIQILQQISHLGLRTSSAPEFRMPPPEPKISARSVGPISSTRISPTPRATWVALVGWLVALLVVLVAGVLMYRRRAATAASTES